jgi:magnesium-transporting ATPase (P-type)
MSRVRNCFIAFAVSLLACGPFVSTPGLDILIGQWQGGLHLQILLYGVAALCVAFSVLYSIKRIPFDPTMAKWHFWYSLCGVVLCIVASVIFWSETKRAGQPAAVEANLFALAVVAGLLMFLSVQLWFVFDLTRAVFKLFQTVESE